MAVNNTPGLTSGGLGEMLRSMMTSGAESLATSGLTTGGLNTGVTGAPKANDSAALAASEMALLEMIRGVPRWLKEEQARAQFQNELFLKSVADIQRHMPPLGIKPSAAELQALHNDLRSIAEAAGSNPGRGVLALEGSLETFIETAETAQPEASENEPVDTASESNPGPSGGEEGPGVVAGAVNLLFGAVAATKAAPKTSLTKGGYTSLKSASKFAAPGIKVSGGKTPPKKGPTNTKPTV